MIDYIFLARKSYNTIKLAGISISRKHDIIYDLCNYKKPKFDKVNQADDYYFLRNIAYGEFSTEIKKMVKHYTAERNKTLPEEQRVPMPEILKKIRKKVVLFILSSSLMLIRDGANNKRELLDDFIFCAKQTTQVKKIVPIVNRTLELKIPENISLEEMINELNNHIESLSTGAVPQPRNPPPTPNTGGASVKPTTRDQALHDFLLSSIDELEIRKDREWWKQFFMRHNIMFIGDVSNEHLEPSRYVKMNIRKELRDSTYQIKGTQESLSGWSKDAEEDVNFYMGEKLDSLKEALLVLRTKKLSMYP